MDPQSVRRLVPVLEQMADLELAFEAFYGRCAELWPKSEDLWKKLRKEEAEHAAALKNIIGMLNDRPEEFGTGRTFGKDSVSSMTGAVRHNSRLLGEKITTEGDALTTARAMEAGLLEKKFHEVLQSNDSEFRYLCRRMETDTEAHKAAIDRRIAEIRERMR